MCDLCVASEFGWSYYLLSIKSMKEIELERTYLVKKLPEEMKMATATELLDIYLPSNSEHPILRIRKRGGKYMITKKHPIVGTDSSEQSEETILLLEDEYNELSQIKGKRVRKNRYTINKPGMTVDIDVFLDDLDGLVTVDFEFLSNDEKNNFEMPDWCLADVTQEKIIAGGMLAGKKYDEIAPSLRNYKYNRITM